MTFDRRQAPERLANLLTRDGPRFGNGSPGQQFSEYARNSDGRAATVGPEGGLLNFSTNDFQAEPHDVPAAGRSNFPDGIRRVQISDVPRVKEMVEDQRVDRRRFSCHPAEGSLKGNIERRD